MCSKSVFVLGKKKKKKLFISFQMAVDTQFRFPSSKMYTVRKHVCINCDGGNRSFTLLHMRRASWILLTVLRWILHFLSPVTFREAVTLKFPAFWQFQTNLHRRGRAAEAQSWLGCPHRVSRLSQGCICLRLTGPTRKPNSTSVSLGGSWGEKEKSEVRREGEIRRDGNCIYFK